jgi:hypothetical protein
MKFPSARSIELAFPHSASSVIEFFDRKVNLDHFPADGPLYPILRAWVRDDPFRTTPRAEANIDVLRSRAAANTPTRKADHRTAVCETAERISTVPLSGPKDRKKKKSTVPSAQVDLEKEDQDDNSSVEIETLRQEMIQRAQRIRRQKSRRINRECEAGLKSLRERGISI